METKTHSIFSDASPNGESHKISALYRAGDSKSNAGGLVLFLHGLACIKESWEAAFSQPSLKNFSLLAPDLPGHGESAPSDSFPYRMEDMAEIIGKLLREYEYERLHIVAHSMGGAVGLLLAPLLQDSRLSSFINIEGNLTHDDCSLLSRRTAEMEEGVFVSGKYAKLLAKLKSADDNATRIWAGWVEKTDPTAFYRCACSLVHWSDSGRLLEIFHALDLPKTYIYGRQSANPAVIAELYDVPTHCIEDSGHFVMTEAPDKLYEIIGENLGRFLGGHASLD